MRQRKKKCRLLLLAYIQLCVYVLLVFNIMAFGFYRIKTIFSNERQTPLVTDNARKHSALAEAALLLPIIITKCPYYSHHYLINLSSSNESELDKHAIESSGLIEQTHIHTQRLNWSKCETWISMKLNHHHHHRQHHQHHAYSTDCVSLNTFNRLYMANQKDSIIRFMCRKNDNSIQSIDIR